MPGVQVKAGAWDFQWSWYTCPDVYQVDQGGRALGKTVGITMRAFAFPFNFEGRRCFSPLRS